MTKPGYTHIIVSIDVHKKLKQLAKQHNTSINKLLKQILSINTSINTKTPEKSLEWCSGRDLNPRLRLERPVYLSGLYYRSIF